MNIVGAKHHIDVAGPFLDEIPILLGQTAGHCNLKARSSLLGCLEVAQSSVEPVVGVLPDATRVENDHVCLVLRGGRYQSVGFEQAGNPLAVVLVHLTPVGAHRVGTGHAYRLGPGPAMAEGPEWSTVVPPPGRIGRVVRRWR